MKKLFIAVMLCALFTGAAIAQNAVLHVTIANTSASGCRIWLPTESLVFDYAKKGSFGLDLDANGSGSHTFELTKPEYVHLTCSSSDQSYDNVIHYYFYLSPGDDIDFKADFKSKDNGIVVTGKGRDNNQPMLGALPDVDMQPFYAAKDTLPNRFKAAVNRHYAQYKAALDKYITLYKPSADFIKNERLNLAYTPMYEYFEFKESNKFAIGDAFDRNKSKWNTVQDSLSANAKLNNSEALTAYNYALFLRMFLLREKERLWHEASENNVSFYKEWYDTDTANGKKLFMDDMQNRLQEKIINKYFTNQSAEYLYAVLFDNALGENNPKNIVSIFDGFKLKYPGSKYIAWFSADMDTIRKKEHQPLTADMVFAAGNGAKLNTLEDLLALTKGKTVLLDMWGTWCGPCRNEIHNNGPALKAYFKGKGLDYFYVANYDVQNEVQWKKLIAYFGMTGTHVLANYNLTKDIMAKVKGTGFPTYVVIKKDGSWELSKAGYPMNRDVLIQQLEEALAH